MGGEVSTSPQRLRPCWQVPLKPKGRRAEELWMGCPDRAWSSALPLAFSCQCSTWYTGLKRSPTSQPSPLCLGTSEETKILLLLSPAFPHLNLQSQKPALKAASPCGRSPTSPFLALEGKFDEDELCCCCGCSQSQGTESCCGRAELRTDSDSGGSAASFWGGGTASPWKCIMVA